MLIKYLVVATLIGAFVGVSSTKSALAKNCPIDVNVRVLSPFIPDDVLIYHTG